MGFSSGIYKTKKFTKDFTIKDIDTVNCYLDYINNEWAMVNYADWKCYAKNHENINEDWNVIEEELTFYKPLYIKHDKYSSPSVWEELESWCSDGAEFHEMFNPKDDVDVEITKEKAYEILAYCIDEIEKYSEWIPVQVDYAIKKQDEDFDCLKLYRCDGVEVVDEYGKNLKIFWDDTFEDSKLFIPKTYFNEYDFKSLYRLLKVITRIITTTDWDAEIIKYSGGY